MENVQQTIKQIRAGKLAPIYVLVGTEQYFIDQIRSAIQLALKSKVNDDIFSTDLLETSIQDIVMDLETIPFFNEHRLMFVYHPYFFTSKTERTSIKHDIKALENYIQNPAPFSTVVFIAPYEKLDARKKITKQLKSHAQLVDCSPIKMNELPGFIDDIAQAHSLNLATDILHLFATQFENNLYVIEKEIEKLAVYAGEDREVTMESALALMSQSLTGNGLQLVDAVMKKDVKVALQTYQNIQKLGEEPIALLALLASQIRHMLQAKILLNQGYPLQHIQSEMRAHPYVIKLAVERSRQFSLASLEEMIQLLVRTDERIKRGLMEPNIAFEMLLYHLMRIK